MPRHALHSKDLRRWTDSAPLLRCLRWKRRREANWAIRHANGAERLPEPAGRKRAAAARPLFPADASAADALEAQRHMAARQGTRLNSRPVRPANANVFS